MNEIVNTEKTKYKFIVYFICIVAALGGLLFGLDQGFIANALPTINEVYHLNLVGGEKFSAVLFNGAAIGAVVSGLLARFLGRKRSLLLAGALFVVMSGVSAFLPPYTILYWSRFFLGLAVGIASFVVPLYLAEAAPAKIRGAMGTLFQLMITFGIFLISATNVVFVKIIASNVDRLPWMFVVIVIFALVMFVGAIFLPESPRWYMLKGKKDKAEAVLKKILSTQEEIDLEIREISEAISSTAESGGAPVRVGTFIKVLLVGVFMMVFQQLVGINVMIYYAPTIFGYASIVGIVAMMTVPLVNLLFTFPAIWLVEKWGRKKLLYVGSILMLVTMVAAGFVFCSTAKYEAPANKCMTALEANYSANQLKETIAKLNSGLEYKYPKVAQFLSKPETKANLEKLNSATDKTTVSCNHIKDDFESAFNNAKIKDMATMIPGISKAILLVAVIIYIFGFAFSWGPVAWLICSEIFPIKGREIGMTVTTMVNWFFGGLVISCALSIMQIYGNASLFFIFAIGCILSMIFLYLWVPETRGITLEEFEVNLKNGVKLKNLGNWEKK